ncbi:MAG: YCF48-related protein [Pseudanabaenales cyanobacterium]|nr:YCF48-related protein [Pseudanabaenales cyanobacterium]
MSIHKNGYRWIATQAEIASRYDDIFFISPDVGWAINSNGRILKTVNGGRFWDQQFHDPNVYFRCISMVNEQVGWAGCTTPGRQLFHTNDGGDHWEQVANLPTANERRVDAPSAVCGLWALDEQRVFASGTNYPERPARFLKTEDGGKTWYVRDMEDVATLLVDIYFQTENVGWVVGGRATKPNPRRTDVVPTVLKTENGGETWRDMLSENVNAPLGEWGWKIQFLKGGFGVVACENFKAGAILITENGGNSWRRQEIRDSQGKMINENLEGIGFLDRQTGWVGGWGDKVFSSGRTSRTTDGGRTWTDLTPTWPRPVKGFDDPCPPYEKGGQYINRFRFVGDVAYASGNTVYKYTNQRIHEPTEVEISSSRLLNSVDSLLCTDQVDIPIVVSSQTRSLSVILYDRFAGKVRTLIEETNPVAGRRLLNWDLKDDNGEKLTPGQFMVRVNCDDVSESRLIFHIRTGDKTFMAKETPHLLRED